MSRNGKGGKVLDVTAILVSVTAIIYTLGDNRSWFKPTPYNKVEIDSVERKEDGLHVIANFVKVTEDCKPEKVVVFGYLLDSLRPLDFIPIREGRVERERTAGPQRMELVIDEQAERYDEIEVRTRHNCNGIIVDKTMLRVDVP